MTPLVFIDKKIEAIVKATGLQHYFGEGGRCTRCDVEDGIEKALRAAIKYGARRGK
jgi:hypothetical protein